MPPAQFGKNHFGDRDDMLPTNHGFDEFFGNLYHLNAEEEPENVDYPADMTMPDGRTFKQTFGPRGVIHSTANADGTQTIEDTGPLTRKRMETIDEEVTSRTLDWMDKTHASGKPMFLWYNTTRMHIFTHLKEASQGVTGLGVYADGMVEHDGMVGEILKKIEDLGIEDNTIIMYSTDNGAEVFTWPDGGTTQFKSEKNSPWEGGYRVPTLIKWPGVIKPGTIINDIGAHEDMLPTLLAAAGDPTVIEDLKKGETINGRDYKVHLDGSDLRPALEGKAEWPRKSFIYWTDGGNVAALRYGNWKAQYLDQPAHGLGVWQEPFVTLRAPLLTNLRTRPVREGAGRGCDGLSALVHRTDVHVHPGDGLHQPVDPKLQGVPGADEARQLRPAGRDGCDVRHRGRKVIRFGPPFRRAELRQDRPEKTWKAPRPAGRFAIETEGARCADC